MKKCQELVRIRVVCISGGRGDPLLPHVRLYLPVARLSALCPRTIYKPSIPRNGPVRQGWPRMSGGMVHGCGLNRKMRTNVTIHVEVRADNAGGFDEHTQRAVRENCKTLKFKNAEFEG